MNYRTKLGMMFALLLVATMTVNVMAMDKVIYGDDDRLDLYQTTNTLHLELAKSTAAMIDASSLTKKDDSYEIQGETLKSRGICASALFAEQITAAMCSGFLVGRNLLVTAGHCIRSQSDCDKYRWVFDYGLNSADEVANFSVPASSVYKCKRVVKTTLDRGTMDDFAVVELDREVEGREPLAYRKDGQVEVGEPLVVIGHPTGLPTKVAAGAAVRNNSNKYYLVANLDTFGGNSGSAVFNSETGLVEGILVRGETDYVYDYDQGCQVPKVCTNSGCRGEDVTRITNIKELLDEAVNL